MQLTAYDRRSHHQQKNRYRQHAQRQHLLRAEPPRHQQGPLDQQEGKGSRSRAVPKSGLGLTKEHRNRKRGNQTTRDADDGAHAYLVP